MKKNLKNFYKIVTRLIGCFLIVLLIAILPTTYFSIKNIKSRSIAGQQVLEIWNIDTFEGGTGSKSSFLTNAAIEFEKENKGNYFMVKNMSIEECLLAIGQGQMPHIFSYGLRVGATLANYFENLSLSYEIDQKILDSGKIDQNLVAVGWCRNAYCLIAKNIENNISANLTSTGSVKTLKNGKEKITYSVTFGDLVNKPTKAYSIMFGEMQNSKTAYDQNNISKTAYQAYCDFVEDKANILIGTIRDIARVENRISQGKLQNISYQHLGEYTDMVQYFSISKNLSDNEKEICEKFMQFVVGAKMQQSLSKIGLIPTLCDLKLYSSGVMSGMEECAREVKIIENMF